MMIWHDAISQFLTMKYASFHICRYWQIGKEYDKLPRWLDTFAAMAINLCYDNHAYFVNVFIIWLMYYEKELYPYQTL